MGDKLHKTKGIVLRTVKYGETSLVVTVFTELFGVQSYLVSGVRSTSARGGTKAVYFQPAAILDLVVYHNELKQLNRIQEYGWSHIYRHVFSEVPANAVALYMMELLSKCLRQPETNTDLFHFTEDCLLHLDKSKGTVLANLSLFFSLHLPYHFGFRMTDNYTKDRCYLDLQEGSFSEIQPGHPYFLEEKQALVASRLLKVMQPEELADLALNHDFRRLLLQQMEIYYALHVPDFGTLRTLPVLREVLR